MRATEGGSEDDKQMMLIYEWIDSIPLSREKKNIARDFCDGLLLAEILKVYYPKLVDLHNYPSASSTKQKQANWNTMCRKVFKKINMEVKPEEITEVIASKPKAIEKILVRVYRKVTMNTLRATLDLNDSAENEECGNNEIKEIEMKIRNRDEEIMNLTMRKEEIESGLNENGNKIQILNYRINQLNELLQQQEPEQEHEQQQKQEQS